MLCCRSEVDWCHAQRLQTQLGTDSRSGFHSPGSRQYPEFGSGTNSPIKKLFSEWECDGCLSIISSIVCQKLCFLVVCRLTGQTATHGAPLGPQLLVLSPGPPLPISDLLCVKSITPTECPVQNQISECIVMKEATKLSFHPLGCCVVLVKFFQCLAKFLSTLF